MIAKITPLIKLPRHLDYFDYLVPAKFAHLIKDGQLVIIPFRQKKIYGVIRSLNVKTDLDSIKLNSLDSLTEIILPENLIKLVDWASNYYLVSAAIIYKMIIPPAAKFQPPKVYLDTKKLFLNKREAEETTEILDKFKQNGADFFIYENNLKTLQAVFIKLIKKDLERGGQVLLLVPAIQDIINFSSQFFSYFKNEIIAWHAGLKSGEKYNLWKNILKRKPALVIGTKSAVFLPYTNLSLILIYNAASPDHKQWDRNPRYDSRPAAEKLKELHQAKIIFSDIIPSLKIFYDFKKNKIKFLNSLAVGRNLNLVDIRREKHSPSPLFSFPLYQLIKVCAKERKRLILFLNRRAGDFFRICKDCRYVFVCSVCGRPLEIDNSRQICYSCRITQDLYLNCPRCGGVRIGPLFIGRQTLKKIISREFPGTKIETAAKGAGGISLNFDILITTDYFWKNILPQLDKKDLGGAALVDFDFYLVRPELNQKEITLLAIYRALNLTRDIKNPLLVQTSSPENKIFNEYEKIYHRDLAERKELNYPPYRRAVKIICKEKNEAQAEENSQKLFQKLKKMNFHPLPPFRPFAHKKKYFLRHILLKENLAKDLKKLIAIVPDNYQIDIDPVTIY